MAVPVALVSAAAAVHAPAAAAAAPIRVSVTAAPASATIADGFLGLALEYSTIPRWVGTGPGPVNPVLVQLIRNLDPAGRPVLRIGGLSTDRTWWPVPGMSRPLGVTYDLSPAWTAAARALAQATAGRYLLGLNLEANRPRLDQVEAAQLIAGIGRTDIEAFEIGNEPDLYTVIPWYIRIAGRPAPWYSQGGTPVYSRRPTYGAADYVAEVRRVLAVIPPLPIAGPETGTAPWLQTFAGLLSPHSQVRMLTSHAYPLNACVTDPSASVYPTLANLLGPIASRGLTTGLAPEIALAHRDRATYRIDELGTVSCNGRAGVSDTMASALWAVDALFAIAAARVDGVNLHSYPDSVNGLFDFTRTNGQWSAEVHPLYYGALLFAQAAPAGSRLLTLTTSAATGIRTWATAGPGRRLRVVLIDDRLGAAVRALVTVPAGFGSGPATLERLSAPSASATAGVTLGGQSFGAATDTGILAAPVTADVPARSGAYAVTLPPASAALLTLPG